jgi:hypothetical protein
MTIVVFDFHLVAGRKPDGKPLRLRLVCFARSHRSSGLKVVEVWSKVRLDVGNITSYEGTYFY